MARPIIQNPLSSRPSNSNKSSSDSRLCLLVSVAVVLALLIGSFLCLQVIQSLQEHNDKLLSIKESEVSSSNKNSVLRNGDKSQRNDRPAISKHVAAQHNKRKNDIQFDISADKETLILQTSIGDIRIVLRPDLSKESVEYIHQMSRVDCHNCRFYRADKPGILQGILANREKVPINTVKGSCPQGYESIQNECPEWDAQCACHGPMMTKGMVAWAAGDTGPDFFIDNYKRKADWWGTQHTVWGEVQDAASFAVIDKVWDLPAHDTDGLTLLNKDIPFQIVIVSSEVE